MRLHGNIYLLGALGAAGLAVDDDRLARRLEDVLTVDRQLGVRVAEQVVVGRVSHAEVVETPDGRKAVSVTIDVDDEVLRKAAPLVFQAGPEEAAS